MMARDNDCPFCHGRLLGHKMPSDLITERLAQGPIPVQMDREDCHRCALCGVESFLSTHLRIPESHLAACPWRMAVELFPQPVPTPPPDPEASLPRCGWN